MEEIDKVSIGFQNVSNDTSKLYVGMESTVDRTEYISDFVNEFKEVEQQLSNAMENMVKSINEIANSSTESAQATESIAISAKAVSENTIKLVNSVEQAKESCDNLIKVMGRFTV